jgi:phosphoglucosamine mutase
MKYFGTSGIRRIADTELIRIAQLTGLSVGTTYKKVLVGTDTRVSNESVKAALISGLLMTGCEVYDAGVAPTPTIAYAGRSFDCAAMITASHNPPEYNGIKMLNPDGSPFTNEQQKTIEDVIDGITQPVYSPTACSRVKSFDTAVEDHIKKITELIPGDFKKVKVVLDPCGGAATMITEKLLRRMGCQLTVINGEPNGIFPRPAEPIPENLVGLCEKVKETGADLGIAHDGDADRVMAVDSKGRCIPGDKLVCMFAEFLKKDKIVTTVDASMAVEESCKKVLRCPVGDNNVSELMMKHDLAFGGEPSGAWVFKETSLCPDGIYGAALLLRMASTRDMAEWADSYPSYPMIRSSIKGIFDMEKIGALLRKHWKDAEVTDVDGLRFALKDSWFLARKSGTEPKLRFTVEAKDDGTAQALHDKLMEILGELK